MEGADLEEVAQAVRAIAKLDDDDLRLAPEIAAIILGENGVRLARAGTVAHLDDQTIYAPEDHPDLNFAVGHELGEWALRYLAKFQGTHVERERAANYLAAAIVAPYRTVERAHSHFGEKLRAIAEVFALSQTSATLRLAEVRGDERAVVTKSGNILMRSQGAFPWADVPVVDVARGKSRWRTLAKASLRGGIDEGRVALRVK